MKTTMVLVAAFALAMPVLTNFAAAGPIEKACNRSNRQAATRSMCNCIGQVADQSLGGADQRKAAAFFKDPEKAHETWMSKSKSNDAFWDRYKAFSAQAEAFCAG